MSRNFKTLIAVLGLSSVLLLSYGVYVIRAEMRFIESQGDLISELKQQKALQQVQKPSWPAHYKTLSGSFLSAHFAQNRNDWARAADFLTEIRDMGADSTLVDKRAMILSLGSGRYETALELARSLAGQDRETASALLPLLVFASDIKDKNHGEAEDALGQIPQNSMSRFILPVLEAWTKAALQQDHTLYLNLHANKIHFYHAALISHYMGMEDKIRPLLQKVKTAEGITADDLENVADMYVRIGDFDQALETYNYVRDQRSGLEHLRAKIKMLQENPHLLQQKLPEIDPAHGVALAFLDMAQLLNTDRGYESARVFGNLALYLDPHSPSARLLLAGIAASQDRMQEGIAHLKDIGQESFFYGRAQAMKAEILAEDGQPEAAIGLLEALYEDSDNIDYLITAGNIYREAEDNEKALQYYNRAASHYKSGVPESFWYLYYVRGMTLEQMDRWPEAEADLKAALEIKPNHPYVLNYLAYAWAEQGVHLQEATNMLERAARLRPDDGYIADSLGWVYVRKGLLDRAVPYLEKAVELLPYDPVVNDHLGDAYWKTGRHLEARFQWLRAYNHIEDDKDLRNDLAEKLENGLQYSLIVKEAQSLVTSHSEQIETIPETP